MMTIAWNRRSPRTARRFRHTRPRVEALEVHLALSPTLPLPPPAHVDLVVTFQATQPSISPARSFEPPDPCIGQLPSLYPPGPCIR
jgi:hypothetical protein